MKALERRIERIEQQHADGDEIIEVLGIKRSQWPGLEVVLALLDEQDRQEKRHDIEASH